MNKENKTAIFIIIAVTIIMIIGSTFAYFTWVSNTSQRTTVSFTSGTGFSCSANGGGNITSNDIALAPTTCTDANRAIKRTITVNPTITQSDGDIYLDMWLKVNSIGSGLSASQNFKYALTTDGTSCTSGTVVAQGNFNGATTDTQIPLLTEKAYSQTTTDTYYLWIWLDAAEESPDTQGQSFDLQLGGSCTNATPSPKLVETIIQNAILDNTTSDFVTNSNGIQFSDTSSDTNGKGVYIRSGTENDAHPIYYYRGAVDNNNVLFAGFCWKIVRTTSTGGTKLIYNGLPSGTNNNECTNTTGTATQLASTSMFNNTSDSPADVGYMYGTRYAYLSVSGTGWYYAPDVTYSNGTYTLVSKGSYNVVTKSTINGTNLNYQHYTCGSATATTCASVRYVYYVSSSSKAYYITLTNGKKVENALDEMFTNTTDSTIKTAIDTWYANNMISYTSQLEDTPYCNDRTIYQLGGWNANGGGITDYLRLAPYQRAYSTYIPSLTCNTNDAFTVSASNGNGKLTYPVGLLTSDEIMLAGGKHDSNNLTYYLRTNQDWWAGSPTSFTNSYALESIVSSTGSLNGYTTFSDIGVRPVVSLKRGTKFSSGGDGTATNPYMVE